MLQITDHARRVDLNDIEGDTKIAFSEDVQARYDAYGWHTQHVDFTQGGGEYKEDVDALYAAIRAALVGGWCDVLITDSATAEVLLAD